MRVGSRAFEKLLAMSLEDESVRVAETVERAVDTAASAADTRKRGLHGEAARAGCWFHIPSVTPLKIRSVVMRWNGQWIGGDRFARDYAAGVMSFNSEVAQAVSRFHPVRHCPVALEFETHAAVWAAVLMAFEAASFRDPDRETLLAALLAELRARWSEDESSPLTHEAAIFERAMDYLALRDCGSQLKTAARIVKMYLLSLGLPGQTASSALAGHLSAIFGYRILRDIYRLSAASRLRTAAVTMVERQRRLRSGTSSA